jgi:hypothetical protein
MMIKVSLILIITQLAFVTLFAQKTKTDKANIELHCGWAAWSCPEVIAYKKLVAAKNYPIIKSKLTNGSLTEKVLSAIALDELTRSQQVILTNEEEILFKSIRSSKDLLEICYTCTWHYKGKIREFFHPKKENGMTELTPYGVILDELFGR